MDEGVILDFLRSDPSRTYTLPEIAKRIGVDAETKALRRLLKGLVKRGEIERERGRSFRISRAGQTIEGRITFDERRQAWLEPLEKGRKAKALLLVPDEAARVEEGDRVLAEVVAVGGRRGRVQARVREVLERPQQFQLGIFRRIAKVIFVELEAQGEARRLRRTRTPIEVLVPPDQTGDAEDGQLVRVEISRKGRGATASSSARVLEVIGKPGERETEMRRLMIEHHLTTAFPEAAEAEAQRYGREVSPTDSAGRRDLRTLPLVTIDGETAKDFDDAVCAVHAKGGGYVLYVAIADVAHYVRPGMALDQEALRRGTSTYLTDRAIPMLPEALSNNLCSLMPHVDRLCMVAELTIDRGGHIEKTSFYDAVMRSHARLTYTRVAAALEGDPDEECKPLLPTLLLLSKVGSLLLQQRLKRGAIDLDLPEPYVVFDETNFPVDVKKRERNDAHRLIEDLMLAANEAVASVFVELKLPSLFRIHEDPDPEKLQVFLGLVAHLGLSVKLKRHPRPKDVAQLLEKISETPVARALNPLLLRSLMQARYDADCKGHFGLAAERYLHFTSPIRRYPDLMVHRLLKRILGGGDLGYSKDALQEIAKLSSEAERRAMLAERGSMDLDRSYVALEHLNEEFKATITTVTSFGLFASIDHPFIEGLIPIQMLGEEYFEIDEYNSRLTGSNTGAVFMIGQAVEVEIAAVNLNKRQVEFKLVGAEETARGSEKRPDRRRRGKEILNGGGRRGRGGKPAPDKKKRRTRTRR